MMSKNTRILVLSSAAICAAAAFADFVYPADTIFTVPYTQMSSSSTIFRDRDGNATNWVDGSYMVFLHESNGKWPGNTTLSSWYAVRGLRFETHYAGEYLETGGGFAIGSAGLEMTVAGSNVSMGRSDKHGLAGRIKLMENQTWKGPESGSNAAFSFTFDTYTHRMLGSTEYNMHNDFLDADPSVTSWTVQDHLTVWFCHTNALQNVDVRIVNPARIRCRTKVFDSDSSTYYAGLHAKSLTLSGDAEMWQAGGKQTSYQNAYESTMQPLMDTITMAPTVILEDGADMKLIGAQWDIPTLRVTGADATSSLKGDCTFLRASTAVELQDGVTLEFPATNREDGVSAGISVTGTGSVKVFPEGWHLTGTLALGDDVTLLMGEGSFAGTVSGGKRYVIDPGAGKECVLQNGASGAAVEKVEVLSGTCLLPSMASMPANVQFEVADGATLLFSTDGGYDASRVTLNGSGTCRIDGLFVTDTLVTDEEIVVNQDEVLRILGNGLTAATRVKLAGGTLRLERNGVVVASPLQVTDNSFIESIAESVTGTVAGVVACTNVASGSRSVAIPKTYGGSETKEVKVLGLWVLGPGTTVFSGGGAFADHAGDRLVVTRGAYVHLTGGTYRFESQTTSSDSAPLYMNELTYSERKMTGTGRYLCVRDGGDLRFASSAGGGVQPKIFVIGPKDGSAYDSTGYNPVFEIGQGGTVTIPVNSTFYLGYTDNRVHLKITGGTLNLETASSRLYFGAPSAYTACGEIYLESGMISTGCALMRYHSNQNNNRFCRGRLIWSGGTLKLNSNFTAPNILDMHSDCYKGASPQQHGMLRVSARIIGENCVLDLSDLQADSVTNVPAVLDEAEWYGHGTLTVKGGKELVMNSVPDGFSLKLEGEGTRVKVAEGAYVYDYDTCYQYKDWKGYDGGNSYSVTNTALTALSVAAYTLAGTNCGFSVARADLPVTVTNITVNGEWNGAVALAAAGGLTAENLTFGEGALLSVPYANGETAAFALTGGLTLPAAMDVRAVQAADAALSGQTVFTAAEGATGSPAWNMLTGRFKIFADGSRVWIVPKGTMLTIR